MTNENQTKKFFIYARKSTDSEDRQIRSIADQLAELRELAKKKKIYFFYNFFKNLSEDRPTGLFRSLLFYQSINNLNIFFFG